MTHANGIIPRWSLQYYLYVLPGNIYWEYDLSTVKGDAAFTRCNNSEEFISCAGQGYALHHVYPIPGHNAGPRLTKLILIYLIYEQSLIEDIN